MVAMQPFREPFNAFHAHTKPKDWLEGLVWTYVGDGFAADFYREVAAFVDPDTRALVHEVLADEGHVDFIVDKVRGGHRRRPAARRTAGPVGPAAGRRGAESGPARRRRPGRADQPADRHRRPAGDGSGRDQPDVLPPDREPHEADGRAGVAGLICFQVRDAARRECQRRRRRGGRATSGRSNGRGSGSAEPKPTWRAFSSPRSSVGDLESRRDAGPWRPRSSVRVSEPTRRRSAWREGPSRTGAAADSSPSTSPPRSRD